MCHPMRALLGLAVAANVFWHAATAIAQSVRTISDVPAALEGIAPNGDLVTFDQSAMTFPAGGHLQGVQIDFNDAMRSRQILISHDSQTVAYLAVVEFPGVALDDIKSVGKLSRVQQLPSDGESPPLRHAGGFQLAGKVLAVGVEDNQAKLRSQIQFWNTADPHRLVQLEHLTIARSSDVPKQATAGAVGLIQREQDYLLAVGNWDCRAIDFYRSNGKSLADPDCRFEHALKWQASAAATDDWKPDPIRGTYQSLNFVRDEAGNDFLLGFDTTPAGRDVIDLFEVDLARGRERALRKVARKTVSLEGDNHFRYAGGAVVHDGKLLILSSERNFKPAGITRLNVLR